MRDAPKLHSIVDAAEQAGAAGDWASAEELLRQAVNAQEAQLGPVHPELANTLNNLGVVCERTGKLDEAEQCYRRAYSIATAVLPPTDPFVVTSGQNLRDFCEARGSPFALTLAPPTVAAQPEAGVHREAQPTPGHEAVSRTSRQLVAGVTIAVGLALAVLIASRSWFGSDESFKPPPESATGPPTAQATPTLDARTVAPPRSVESNAMDGRATLDAERRLRPATVPVPVSVVEAQLCSSLSTNDWRCTPATNLADPGLFFFYTRVRSSIDTTVEHQWYYEGRLLRTVTLRLGANQGPGYRTYSRNTISAGRAGNWRVVLRSQNGTILHEERFRVRN